MHWNAAEFDTGMYNNICASRRANTARFPLLLVAAAYRGRVRCYTSATYLSHTRARAPTAYKLNLRMCIFPV